MHDTIVVMKDGRSYVGILWLFRPDKGYIALAGCNSAPEQIFLRDVQTAITKEDDFPRGFVRDEDELQRAREMRWDGT